MFLESFFRTLFYFFLDFFDFFLTDFIYFLDPILVGFVDSEIVEGIQKLTPLMICISDVCFCCVGVC